MAKLIVLGLFLKGYLFDLSDHFLPMWPVFNYLGSPQAFEMTLQVSFIVFSVLLFFNRLVRASCVVIGLIFLIVPLSSLTSYSNVKILCGFLLLLTGLHMPGEEPWLLRFQIVLVYFGAGLNKLLDPDWQTGQYFEYWMTEIIGRGSYATMASWFPPLVLSKTMCWATIVVEFALVIGFLNKRWYHWAIWLGILFHGSALVLAWEDFGVFTVAILSSYLVFVAWPNSVRIYHIKQPNRSALQADIHNRTYTGFLAFKKILLYCPATYFVIVLLLCLPRGEWVWMRTRAAEILLIAFFPFIELLDYFKDRHRQK